MGLSPEEHEIVTDVIDHHMPPPARDRGVPGHDPAKATARRAQAVRLRLSGMTYEQIAQAVGYSDKGTARDAVMRALSIVESESVTELRSIENARLDQDERALRSIIQDTSIDPQKRVQAINSRIRLSGRRARLNGLDAPVQYELSGAAAAAVADAIAEAESVLVRGEVLSSVETPEE